MEEVQRELLGQAEARVEKAESEAATERTQRKRIMEAAANGTLPLSATSPGINADPAGCSVAPSHERAVATGLRFSGNVYVQQVSGFSSCCSMQGDMLQMLPYLLL